MFSKGLLTVTAAGAAEFETGAAQELVDTGFKAIYSEIKGKEMFETPVGQPNQYVVIVLPGEADVPATRKDVLGTYLYVHGTPPTGIKKKKLAKPTLDETPPTPVKKKKSKTK
jgi:hypothetical protein